jgi:RHS repeat-associated protein
MQRGTLNPTPPTPPTGITGTPVAEEDWTLDPTGNWRGYLTKAAGTTTLNQSRTSNTVNELTAFGASTGSVWANPAYDAAGNTTTFPKASNLTQSFTATYDAWNRLHEVKDGGTSVAVYRYDGRNRRITRTASGTTRDLYYSNAWQVLEERVSGSMDRQYVWGMRYIDEMVCRDDASSQRLYALQDANFNVTALTDAAGAVLERFVYDPYGNASVRDINWTGTSDAYDWLYRHQGGRLDKDTGLYNFRYRDYQPDLGRWGQRDPVGYVKGTNIYQFLNARVLTYSDPQGLNDAIPLQKLPAHIPIGMAGWNHNPIDPPGTDMQAECNKLCAGYGMKGSATQKEDVSYIYLGDRVAEGLWGMKVDTESAAWDYVPFTKGQKQVATVYEYDKYQVNMITTEHWHCSCSCPLTIYTLIDNLVTSFDLYREKKNGPLPGVTADVWTAAWTQTFDMSVTIDIDAVLKAIKDAGEKSLAE